MLLHRLARYIEDPNNGITNYELAKEYERLDQYSASCVFFLRAADRAEDPSIVYQCLVGSAKSLIEHGDNFKMAKNLLLKAIALDSNRTDAYYFLALLHRYNEDHEFESSYVKYVEMKNRSVSDNIYQHDDLTTIGSKKPRVVPTIRFSRNQGQNNYRHKKLR
jgi:hypothetical protein